MVLMLQIFHNSRVGLELLLCNYTEYIILALLSNHLLVIYVGPCASQTLLAGYLPSIIHPKGTLQGKATCYAYFSEPLYTLSFLIFLWGGIQYFYLLRLAIYVPRFCRYILC